MIFKRTYAKLRAQDWMAIVIELLIVILGVFIGVQASNWNAAREDRIRAHQYLERIDDDLATDVDNFRDRLGFWKKVTDYGDAGLRYAETGDSGGRSQWQLLLAYFQASQIAEFYATGTTFDELKSAGQLGLISDLRLRRDLARYYTYGGNAVLSERPAYRVHVRGLIPVDIQRYIWTHCYGNAADGWNQTLVDCPSPVSEAEARAVVDRLRGNPELMEQLRYWMSLMQVASITGRDQMQVAETLRSEVKAAQH